MRRRDLCRLPTAAATPRLVSHLGALERSTPVRPLADRSSGSALYPNHRAPLLHATYIPLPLGAVTPAGWLADQLHLQASGLTLRLGDLWDLLRESAWKGTQAKRHAGVLHGAFCSTLARRGDPAGRRPARREVSQWCKSGTSASPRFGMEFSSRPVATLTRPFSGVRAPVTMEPMCSEASSRRDMAAQPGD